jgi:hypothetical protein
MYKINSANTILRLSDNAVIPDDTSNKDYREYLEWLDEGNTPLPEDPAPEPEIQCSAYQIRVALNHFDLRGSVEELVTTSDLVVKDAWFYASTFMRNHPFVSDMQSKLGLSDAEVEAIFQYAKSVT